MKSKWPLVQEKLFLVKMWCREGMLEKDIAKQLNIGISTFEDYKTKHPELRDALKSSKEIADYEVENSLYKKCVGHYVKEQKAVKLKEVYYDDDGNRCERETVQVVEIDSFIPPDTLAMAMWLNNRKPESWRRNANKERLDEKRFDREKELEDKKYW